MKKVNRICKIILLLFFASVTQQPLTAQIDREETTPGMPSGLSMPGYVIMSNGDTIYGKIRWALKYVENNPVEIKFTVESGNSKTFNASEIKGFGNQQKIWEENNPVPVYLASEEYVSLPSFKKGIPVFIHRLIDGRLTVYQNRSAAIITTTTTHTDTRIDGIAFNYIPGEGLSIGPSYRTDYRILEQRTRFFSYYVSKGNAPYFKVEKDNYEEIFETLFEDCPAIEQELVQNPDLKKFKNFMILVEIYNNLCPVII